MKRQNKPVVATPSVPDRAEVAANVAFLVARGDIPLTMVAPLLGRAVVDGEAAETVADAIAQRVLDGTLSADFVRNYESLAMVALRTQRGCRERQGTSLMLELLLESCPANINPRLKVQCIRKVLETYQGPCCQQSPCQHPAPNS